MIFLHPLYRLQNTPLLSGINSRWAWKKSLFKSVTGTWVKKLLKNGMLTRSPHPLSFGEKKKSTSPLERQVAKGKSLKVVMGWECFLSANFFLRLRWLKCRYLWSENHGFESSTGVLGIMKVKKMEAAHFTLKF